MSELATNKIIVTKTEFLGNLFIEMRSPDAEMSAEAERRLHEECQKDAAQQTGNMDPYADKGVLAFANALMRAIDQMGILSTAKVEDGLTASGKTRYTKIPTSVQCNPKTVAKMVAAGCEWAKVPNPTTYVLALVLRSDGLSSFGVDGANPQQMQAFVAKGLKSACTLLQLSTGPKEAIYQVFGAALAPKKVLASVVKSIDAPSAPAEDKVAS